MANTFRRCRQIPKEMKGVTTAFQASLHRQVGQLDPIIAVYIKSLSNSWMPPRPSWLNYLMYLIPSGGRTTMSAIRESFTGCRPVMGLYCWLRNHPKTLWLNINSSHLSECLHGRLYWVLLVPVALWLHAGNGWS